MYARGFMEVEIYRSAFFFLFSRTNAHPAAKPGNVQGAGTNKSIKVRSLCVISFLSLDCFLHLGRHKALELEG